VPVRPDRAVRSPSRGWKPRPAIETPSIVVDVTQRAICPLAGVPDVETLPPPAELLARSWPGVVRSQVMVAESVTTRSLVRVGSTPAVMYEAPTGAPPPEPPPVESRTPATKVMLPPITTGDQVLIADR
jgi:hypothetical protein